MSEPTVYSVTLDESCDGEASVSISPGIDWGDDLELVKLSEYKKIKSELEVSRCLIKNMNDCLDDHWRNDKELRSCYERSAEWLRGEWGRDE